MVGPGPISICIFGLRLYCYHFGQTQIVLRGLTARIFTRQYFAFWAPPVFCNLGSASIFGFFGSVSILHILARQYFYVWAPSVLLILGSVSMLWVGQSKYEAFCAPPLFLILGSSVFCILGSVSILCCWARQCFAFWAPPVF